MDDTLLTLHGLGVKKAAAPEEVARIMGLPAEVTSAVLEKAQLTGEVIGAKGTYMLTPAGRAKLDASYPQACADLRADASFTRAYERFETVNRKLLALFTRWQTVSRGGVSTPNDHSDPDYDGKIIDELGDLHERAEPILEAFAAVVPRFAIYHKRLADAYDQVLAGEIDYVSGVRVDSYHTVWFEMHEDLLRLLGRTREE